MYVCIVTGIQKLVLAGRMGEAIDSTQQLYPGLLDRNLNLLFMLKCRQFIEMVNGTDSEVRGAAIRSPRSHHGNSNRSSPNHSPVHVNSHSQRNTPAGSRGSSPCRPICVKGHSSNSGSVGTGQSAQNLIVIQGNASTNNDLKPICEEDASVVNGNNINAVGNNSSNSGSVARLTADDDIEMTDSLATDHHDNKVISNGASSTEDRCTNGDTACTNGESMCTNGENLNTSHDIRQQDMGKSAS